MTFTATTDKPTAVAMTQHSYFNLDGGGTGAGAGAGVEEAKGKKKKESKKELSTILDHSLQIDASHYLPKNAETGVPDGTMAPVAGTFLDFRKPKRIGEGSAFFSSSGGNPEEGEPGSAFAGGRRGFDDCFAVDGYKGPGVVRRAAVLSSSSSSSGSRYPVLLRWLLRRPDAREGQARRASRSLCRGCAGDARVPQRGERDGRGSRRGRGVEEGHDSDAGAGVQARRRVALLLVERFLSPAFLFFISLSLRPNVIEKEEPGPFDGSPPSPTTLERE